MVVNLNPDRMLVNNTLYINKTRDANIYIHVHVNKYTQSVLTIINNNMYICHCHGISILRILQLLAFVYITKSRLFKYIENFTTKK